MIAAFSAIPLVGFIHFAQPFLFEEVLHIPRGQQGTLTGQLAAMQEVIVLVLMGIIGAASDNYGRRIIMVIGLCLIAAGLFIYPLASTVMELYLFRAFFAIGAAMVPVMYSATIQDTPANKSRGILTAMTSMCTGLGMVLVAIQMGKLPMQLLDQGFTAEQAGRYSYWVMVGFALLLAALVRLTWRAGRVVAPARTPNHEGGTRGRLAQPKNRIGLPDGLCLPGRFRRRRYVSLPMDRARGQRCRTIQRRRSSAARASWWRSSKARHCCGPPSWVRLPIASTA